MATMTYSSLHRHAGQKRVFDSVFPPSSFKAIPPTPSATPNLPSSSFGQPFGGPNVPATPPRDREGQTQSFDLASEQIAWDRAWHTATTFLSIPRAPVPEALDRATDESLQGRIWLDRPTVEGPEGLWYTSAGQWAEMDVDEMPGAIRQWIRKPTGDEKRALFYLLSSSRGRVLRRNESGKGLDLVTWFSNEVMEHFRTVTLPLLRGEWEKPDVREAVSGVISRLRSALRLYMRRFLDDICGRLDTAERIRTIRTFRRTIYSTVEYSITRKRIETLIGPALREYVEIMLGAQRPGPQWDVEDLDRLQQTKWSTNYGLWKSFRGNEDREELSKPMEDARQALKELVTAIQEAGLGGNTGYIVFANIMNDMLEQFVKSTYSGEWEAPSYAVSHLTTWIEERYTKLIRDVLEWFQAGDGFAVSVDHTDWPNSIRHWKEAAINRLGHLRISELFDVIVEWDTSSGAIEDLRHFITTPANRAHVAASFTNATIQRLLQPGASTLQILQMYISIIRAFKLLDTKGVILDRVARPVRKYLRDRDDTVKVIVNGLLADVNHADPEAIQNNTDTLVELAIELNKATETARGRREDDGELDYDDLNWHPDPIDAAPDYKRSKNSDVIGSLISLFESKDVFVKEFQSVMGERLLTKTSNFEKEIRVLELLKLRFGDSALQACEVMLKDVLDSRRVDHVIREDQNLTDNDVSISDLASKMQLETDSMAPSVPQLHAKILSRLFWPTLQDQTFRIPSEISSLQGRYEKGFENLKQSRKLTWLNSLGSVTVELDLEDRLFRDEVFPYQATVIHAFQSDPSSAISKTTSELSSELEMDETLVLSACIFWISKQILVQTISHPPTFRVLETLPSTTTAAADDPNHPPANATTATTTTTTTAASSSQQPNSATAASQAAADAAAAAEEAARLAAAKAAADAANAKMAMYWQFIVGMLTNQGPMPLSRIVMMLKVAVPGGFPFSNEELKDFLAGKVEGGSLELGHGGIYRIGRG